MPLNDEEMHLRRQWYSRQDVQYEIIKSHVHRETAFLYKSTKTGRSTAIRFLKCDCIAFLTRQWRFYRFLDRQMNLYHSLATFQNFPIIRYDGDYKKQLREINEGYEGMITAFDLGLDIDKINEPFDCYPQAKKLKSLLDRFNVPYSLKISGSGFHFLISHQQIPAKIRQASKSWDDYTSTFLRGLMDELKERFDLPSLDTSVADTRRIWKTPYSVDVKTGNIAFPLSDAEFSEFHPERYSIQNFFNQPFPILRRGMLTRTGQDDALMKLAEEC